MRHNNQKSHNFQAGLLMTVLIGAAFVIHHHEESHYLAGGSDSYSVQENAQTGENASESFVRNRNIPEPAGQAAGSDPQ